MAFFEKMSETLTVKGKGMADKAKELAEVNHLNGQINTQKNTAEKLYKEIGQLIYENREDWKSVDIATQLEQLDSIQEKILELQEEILQVKGVRRCAGCGAEVNNDMAFCPKCGAPMAANEPKQEQNEEQLQEEPAHCLCPGCQKEIEPGSAFCPFCGIRL